MTLKVGDIRKSKNWGDVVIEGVAKDILTIKFIDTGNIQQIKKSTMSGGQFTDSKALEDRMGRKTRPKGSWVVGEVLTSDNWGDFRVLGVTGNRLDVEFLLTGNKKNVRTSEAANGNVRDTESMASDGVLLNHESPQHLAAKIPAGAIYESNLWGNTEVLEYRSSTEVVIKFLNSGNIYTVQKDALEKGFVKDTHLSKQQTQAANDESKLVKDNLRKLQDLHIHISRLNRKIKVCHNNFKRYCESRQRQVDSIFNLYSTIYNHDKYGEYRIESSDADRCVVKFLKTSYLHECLLNHAKGGRVRDYSQFSKEAEREQSRLRNAESYLENREVRLQQAKDWQKANPEKANTRNRNRHAKRKGAEGTHTKAQTDTLMDIQDGKCNCCGVCLTTHEKHLDHIMPLDLGGSNWIENLQWLCQFCNNSKAAKHPDEWAAEILTDNWKARRQQRLEATL